MSFSPEDLPDTSSAGPAGVLPLGGGLPAKAGTPAGLSARDRSRRRKWIYGLSMLALIVVLFILGAPATVGTKDVNGQVGGVLAQYRDSHGLSQTELGQIDPTSESIRLATLGMRGVAAELMWIKANQYQMKKDWTRLRAMLDQISKLQPHSIGVWKYQAWNLSYNVSVAFDDFHDKFYWVIEGLNFMLQGVKLNDKEPRLYWDMAWFISNKIGRDDAAKYYRRLFTGERQPDGMDAPEYVKDFRGRFSPPRDATRGIQGGFPQSCLPTQDNWKVGKAWFLGSDERIAPPRYPVRGMAPVIFYSDAPTCQFYYADAVEKDGVFGQVAERAWQDAEKEWKDFGDRPIEISYANIVVVLNRKEELFDSAQELREKLDTLAPGVKEELEKEKRAKLSPEERAIWDKYREDLKAYMSDQKNRRAGKNVSGKPLLQPSLEVYLRDRAEAKPDEIARRAPQAQHQAAMKLANQIEEDEGMAQELNRERSKVNFDFWRTRARAEQTPDCIAARKAIYDAGLAYSKGDLIRARPLYDKGFHLWRQVLDDPEFNSLVKDVSLGGDLMDDIRRYRNCLDQDDLEVAFPFTLQDIIDEQGSRQGAVTSAADRPFRTTRPAPAPPPAKAGSGEKKGKRK